MAYQVRIDSFGIGGDGGINIGYTGGDIPLPLVPSGNGASYLALEDFVAALQATEVALHELLLPIVLARQYKIDPQMLLPGAYVGQTGVIDLTTPSDPITFGG